MIVVGLVLLLVVVVGAVIVVSEGDDPVRLHLHWFTVHTSGSALFVAGAVALLLAVIGLWMLRLGIRRARRRRREIKDLRHSATAPDRAAARPAAPTPPATPREATPHRPARRQDADDYFDSAPRD